MEIIKKFKRIIFKSKKSKIITSLILVGIIAIAAASYVKAQNAKIKKVTLTQVTRGLLTQSVTITGNIKAKNTNEIALSPASKVSKVLVKEGQTVEVGQVLVKLDSSDYENQLEKQNINLSNAASTLKYITGSSSNMDRSSSQSAVSQAEITLDNAKSNYEDANNKFEQSKVLYERGFISTNEYNTANKAVSDCQNAVSAAEIALSNAKITFSNINATESEKISNQNTQVALINADIKYLRLKIEECSLKTNVAGVVTKMDAVEGQFPAAGDMVIVDETSTLVVDVDVSQYDAVDIKEGQKAVIKVKGIDKEYEGKVLEVGPLAEKSLITTDQDSKVKVKVAVFDPDESLKIGYEADVDVVLSEKQNALQVSFEAVQNEKSTGKKYVFVVDGSNKAEKRYITTGLDTDYNIEILSGLKEGDKCVQNPDSTLLNGDRVKEAGGKK